MDRVAIYNCLVLQGSDSGIDAIHWLVCICILRLSHLFCPCSLRLGRFKRQDVVEKWLGLVVCEDGLSGLEGVLGMEEGGSVTICPQQQVDIRIIRWYLALFKFLLLSLKNVGLQVHGFCHQNILEPNIQLKILNVVVVQIKVNMLRLIQIKCLILTYNMKKKEHEKHIKMFQQQYLEHNTLHALNQNEEDQPTLNFLAMLSQPSRLTGGRAHEKPKHQQLGIQETHSQMQPAVTPRTARRNNRLFKFDLKLYLLELSIGYGIAIGLLALNKVIYFPFFEALIVIVLCISVTPFQITNLFMLLAIPMAIANYNLDVFILTYPQIVICYLSHYLFSNSNKQQLLWILPTTLFSAFGFLILPGIGVELAGPKMALYYMFPWLCLLVKTICSLLNHTIGKCSLFMLQISFFLYGLWMGMILTLDLSQIEFWYLIILFTLDIINTRFQILPTLIKQMDRCRWWPSLVEAQVSGYLAINSLHIVVFMYIVCVGKLNSAHFSFTMASYLTPMYKPFIIWIFTIVYELISLLRLRNMQKCIIVGYQQNSVLESVKRGIGLSLGLWFFYLGLGIPSEIFSI